MSKPGPKSPSPEAVQKAREEENRKTLEFIAKQQAKEAKGA